MAKTGQGYLCGCCGRKKRRPKSTVKPAPRLDFDKCIQCQCDPPVRFNMCYGCLMALKYH